MWQKIKHTVKDKIIKPLARSRRPVSELALTSMVGLFWTLTPLVGVQMSLVLINWFLFRLLGLRFHLAIALAWVWLSNPLTMPFLYFGFYICGFYPTSEFRQSCRARISFVDFSKVLGDANQMNIWESAFYWFNYIYDFLLWPMFLGSAIIAVPIAVLGYVLTVYSVNHHRTRKARAMGISLYQWEKQFIQNQS